MTNSLIHRGPDGYGHWYAPSGKFALGHRRLAIIDLTIKGSQPMTYMERYTITYNGEIYNYVELRENLQKKGYQFESTSDTEVILAAYHEYGSSCLDFLDGMFAFGLYDSEKEQLFCARDRFGEKPFYYCFYNDDFYFASEIKALWALGVPKLKSELFLYNYLVHDLCENPLDQSQTFYSNISKLKSAHYFLFGDDLNVVQNQYWKIDITDSYKDVSTDIALQYRGLFETSVYRRLRSDVPVASSLSGGLDSSSIVAQVAKFAPEVMTFSARFPNFDKDEGFYIDQVVSRYNTRHYNIEILVEGIFSELDLLLYHQEEPFQTGSIYAQWCVYKEARKHGVIVMFDGQGADEYLGGYHKHIKTYLKEIKGNRHSSKKFVSQMVSVNSLHNEFTLRDKIEIWLPAVLKRMIRIKKLLLFSKEQGINSAFFNEYGKGESPFKSFSSLKQMLSYEMTNQGLEKLLKFADRNSMAHSMEVRLPYLNHNMVEFVFSLNSSFLLEDGWSKSILRNAMQGELPDSIIRRRDKVGFEAPHKDWIDDKRFADLLMQADSYFLKEKILDKSYPDLWKKVVAFKYLNS